jgi:hypothetical protein
VAGVCHDRAEQVDEQRLLEQQPGRLSREQHSGRAVGRCQSSGRSCPTLGLNTRTYLSSCCIFDKAGRPSTAHAEDCKHCIYGRRISNTAQRWRIVAPEKRGNAGGMYGRVKDEYHGWMMSWTYALTTRFRCSGATLCRRGLTGRRLGWGDELSEADCMLGPGGKVGLCFFTWYPGLDTASARMWKSGERGVVSRREWPSRERTVLVLVLLYARMG